MDTKQLSGWMRRSVLGLCIVFVATQSDAMSVRDRYLQQHPAAHVETAAHAHRHARGHEDKHHHVVKHTFKRHSLKKHVEAAHDVRHHLNLRHDKHVVAHTLSPRHPSLERAKIDHEQANDAENALQHHPVQHAVSHNVVHHHLVKHRRHHE